MPEGKFFISYPLILDTLNTFYIFLMLFIENWDKLIEMFEENRRTDWKNSKQIGMYEFMQTLI